MLRATTPARPSAATVVIALAVSGTGLGLSGTDLILPAIPHLPRDLGGDAGQAQLVVAAYTAGTAVGLLAWGALATRVSARYLLPGGLLCLAIATLACAVAPSLAVLIPMRLVQGATSAAPAVLAPGLIRALLAPDRALGAFSVLSSVESLVPAVAPIVGAGVISATGWRGPLALMCALTALVCAATWLMRARLPGAAPQAPSAGYRGALGLSRFRRLASSQALTLGALLVFVFGAPVTIVDDLGGGTGNYLTMQAVNVAGFIVAANLSPRLTARHGARPVVVLGTLVAAAGGGALMLYGVLVGTATLLPLVALPVGVGLGLRGPSGFMSALDAAPDDQRGSALVLVATLAVAAAGSGVFSLVVGGGLLALGLITTVALAAAAALTLLSASRGDFPMPAPQAVAA